MAMEHTIQTEYQTTNFWTGPYGMKVPEYVNSVVAADGYNLMNKLGKNTEIAMEDAPEMNKEIYLAKYAESKGDGNYYHCFKPF
jgi:hypothetical protein